MKQISQSENKQESLQIIQSLQLIELLKKLNEEVNSLDIQPNDNQILEDFIEQCFDNSSDDLNSVFSSIQYQIDEDYYFTKRGNCCLYENNLKVFKCQKCYQIFETAQKLGTHKSKIHNKLQRLNKSIKKY